jgi:hypothetical protein
MNGTADLPVVIIGGGPVGLAAAAHLIERGMKTKIVESSTEVGASVRDWGHVRLFSPWQHNVDRAAVRLLERAGWKAPPSDRLPTGGELYEAYLRPLAALPELREALLLGRRVTAITRVALDKIRTRDRARVPFLVRMVDREGAIEELEARAVIDASGTWWTPNPLGAAGIEARGEGALSDVIHYGIPDVLGAHRARYAGRTTMVVGAGHSAANTLIALTELARENPETKILWSTRGEDLTRVFGGGAGDGLAARGQLGADLQQLIAERRLTMIRSFRIQTLARVDGRLVVSGLRAGEPFLVGGIDTIVAATGQRPDLAMLRELRLALDPMLESSAALGPLIDPNEHSCGTVRPHGARELAHPEPGFYVIGSKSYGRAPTFLLATGYEQARSVVAMLDGDEEAALRVELELPETGVCSSGLVEEQSSGCCGPAAPKEEPASCCAPAAAPKQKSSCC